MKRLPILIFTALFLVACANPQEKEIRDAVKRQMTEYPRSSLLDIYKSFFQDNFGPGHMAPDTTVARASILRELESASRYDRHYFEPAGRGENFYRVSLATVADSIVPFDLFFESFYNSIKDVKPVDIELWKTQWNGIMAVIRKMNLNLPHFEADAAALDSLLENGEYAYHHSAAYNALYHPHYRLVKKEIFENNIRPLIDSSRVL